MHGDVAKPGKGLYIGLLLTTLATLAYQLLLTRIFSVTMWYHFSFMAVSVTMFGLTLGAILVYLRPQWFRPEQAAERMGLAALSFSVLIVISFLTHLCIPFITRLSMVHLWAIAVNYALLSLPFVASGVLVTIALTKFPKQVGKLYAVDLIGAGVGCLAVAALLFFWDAPTLVVNIAALASLGAVCCLSSVDARRLRRTSMGVTVALLGCAIVGSTMAGRQRPLIHPVWVKGELEPPPVYQRWNAFSRVAVWEEGAGKPFGWGLSERCPLDEPVEELWLNIDASAGTVLTRFDGDASKLGHLRYDVTNLVHYIRPDSRMMVVGAGGGRDVLSALHFRQPEIVAVEINGAILEAVNGRFGRFTGHLDRRPDVRFVHDEARSYIARCKDHFDIIQVSLIDTWAATSAGAFVLTENSLYTVEAWQSLMDRLTDRGVLSFSRWHSVNQPGELYRLTALAVKTLTELGVADPQDHLIIVHRPRTSGQSGPPGVATLLASRTPFSSHDVEVIRRVAERMAFRVLLTGGEASDDTLARLASGKDLDRFTNEYPIDITPPTDDRPFFFSMLRPRDVFNLQRMNNTAMRSNTIALAVLGVLLITVVVLTALCVIVPLWLTTERQALSGSWPLLVYFSCIGFGFMLVEITLMQRLNVFLGHPIYSITVALFCLLLASGCGSWLSGLLVKDVTRGPSALTCMAALVAVVLLAWLASAPLLGNFQPAPTWLRIAVACGILSPLGLAMGMAFPLGMRAASGRSAALKPWLFGINGATSICGSVLAVVISLIFSISTALLLGVVCYGGAWLAFFRATRLARHGQAGHSTPHGDTFAASLAAGRRAA